MNSRIPLIAAVVGALLIGGATTGSTRASWSEQVAAAGTSIRSGTMAVSASASPTSLSLAQGESKAVALTLTDTSSLAAKNLTQTISASIISSNPSNVMATLAASAGTCTGVALPQVTAPGQSRTTCVSIAAGASAATGTYTVTATPAGDQVAGGWTSVGSGVPISVTVTASALSILTCPATSSGSSGMPLTWTTPSGATAAQLQYLDGSTWRNVEGATASPVSVIFSKATRSYRVQFTGGSTPTSNTVTVTRENNGNYNMSCGAA